MLCTIAVTLEGGQEGLGAQQSSDVSTWLQGVEGLVLRRLLLRPAVYWEKGVLPLCWVKREPMPKYLSSSWP